MGNCVACQETRGPRSRVAPYDDIDYYGYVEVDGYEKPLSQEELSNVGTILDSLEADADQLVDVNSNLMTLSQISDPLNSSKRAEQLANYITDRYPRLYIKMYDHLHHKHDIFNLASREDNEALEIAYRSTRILWNTTSVSFDMCQQISKSKITELLVNDLKSLKDMVLSSTEDHYHEMYIRSLLGTLHSVIHRCFDNRQHFRDLELVELLQIYIEGPVAYQCYALIILTFIMNEEENKKLISVTENVVFFTSLFKLAVEAKQHRLRNINFIFHAIEFAEAIFMLIVDNTAKRLVVEQGVLTSIAQLLRRHCSESENHMAIMMLWSLAFDDDIKHKIVNRKDCMKGLKRLRNSPCDDVRRACIGALWELKEKDRKGPFNMPLMRTNGHVMISYQSDDKDIVLELKERLKTEGYNVWIDVDNMDRSTLSLRAINNAMEEAVENAGVVLICMSDNYKYSNLCRSEAEYIRLLDKTIIFTRVQTNFVLDGWLGELTGDKSQIFDVSSSSGLEDNFKNLVGLIGNQGKEAAPDVVDTVISKVASVPPPKGPVESWDNNDVANWLRSQNLGHLITKFQKYNGKELLALQKMLQRAPSFFYESLKNDLDIQQTHDIVSFTDGLENVSG